MPPRSWGKLNPYGLFFGIDDLIAAVVGFVAGVGAYLINTAISGGDFSFSEMLFSGLAGAATVWLSYAIIGVAGAIIVGASMLAKPAICGVLDQAAMGNSFGERLLGFSASPSSTPAPHSRRPPAC
jgi:hypothetical protein